MSGCKGAYILFENPGPAIPDLGAIGWDNWRIHSSWCIGTEASLAAPDSPPLARQETAATTAPVPSPMIENDDPFYLLNFHEAKNW